MSEDGEGPRVRTAEELGWDDSLYEEKRPASVPRQGGPEPEPEPVPARRGRIRGRGTATPAKRAEASDEGAGSAGEPAEPAPPDEPAAPGGKKTPGAAAEGTAGDGHGKAGDRETGGSGRSAGTGKRDPAGAGPRRAIGAGAAAAGGPARRPRPAGPPGRRPTGAGKRPRRPRWARVLIAGSATMALLVAALGVAAWLYVRELNGNIDRQDLHLGEHRLEKPPPNADGQTPLNILLIGSDARDSEENLRLGGARHTADGPPIADVQMLLHVSADRSNMTVISVPRDTRVTIPACTDPVSGEQYPTVESDTINHSLQRGGPGCTVATWEELTGIPIDHFMMVDFAGVVSMADAIGGVPVCVDANVHDPKSGLRLPAGESVIRGEQALQWLRTRHGFENGSDIGRTRGQHVYLASMVRELQAGARLTDPGKLNALANAATRALTVDRELGSVTRLYELGEDLRRVPTERINMITMPWIPDPMNPSAHVVPEPGAAEELFALVREDVALDDRDGDSVVDPGGAGRDGAGAGGTPSAEPTTAPRDTVSLAVRNGTGSVTMPPVNGRAGELVEVLRGLGFVLAEVDERPISQADTTLSYPSDDLRADALAIAEELGLPKRSVRISPSAETITLVIGTDWREGGSYPKPVEDPERRGDEEHRELDDSKALSADDDSACMTVNPGAVW
ncbi:LytR family transcriptional regulator [Streptomyces calidiresistens]|uniref:LytR family transcriptional regulator n=1 Tax=Streptomyces calidiresistens TaxID=1485586 RepID=A0A7W3T108_9ACTN|nr:LytR family transcriptional regulator [Streptomyces calidiresistens]